MERYNDLYKHDMTQCKITSYIIDIIWNNWKLYLLTEHIVLLHQVVKESRKEKERDSDRSDRTDKDDHDE